MPMNPRLLRPRASGFDPRSISGLALWLDGADTSSLYTTDAGPVTPVSAPTEISGCVGWWDASDASTLFAADTGSTLATTTVGRWANKGTLGSSADLLQATSGNRPTISAGALAGRNTLTFDGTSDSLRSGSLSLTSTLTYILVMRFESDYAGVASRIVDAGGGGTRAGELLLQSANTLAMFGGSTCSGVTLLSGAYRSYGVYAAQFSATDPRLTYGGSSITLSATTTGANAGSRLTVGGDGSATAGQLANASIAELCVFSSTLSTTDRARVEAYLAAKWGIAGVHAQATATSDPVGYWRDKSGNNRHFTQSLGSARPTASLAAQNGRNCLTFDGTRRLVSSVPSTQWSFLHDGSQPYAIYAVWQANSGAIRTLVATGDSSQGIRSFYCWHDFGTLASNNVRAEVTTTNAGNFVITRNMGNQTAGVPRALQIIGDLSNATAANRMLLTTNYGAASTASTTGAGNPATGAPLLNLTIGSLSPTSQSFGFSGTLCELVMFNRATVLSSRDQALMLGYLNRKWGLVPQVSNADAQDWVNRVYANSGTVSSTTASAVNTFCNAVDAAGLRDRFYRLNLFCGTGLSACLVPLYRGPSLGGTQYGNTTDTNNGPFVSGDYAEDSGLLGNSTTKWLNTGFRLDNAGLTLAAPGVHVSAVVPAYTQDAARNNFPISAINAAINNRYWLNFDANSTPITRANAILGGGSVTASKTIALTNGAAIPGGLWIASRVSDTDLRLYNGNTEQASASTSVSGGSMPDNAMSVFARWNGSSTFGHFEYRIRAYSVGLGMTAAQVASFNTAMTTLQSALGRA